MKDSLKSKIAAWTVLIEKGEPFENYFSTPSLRTYQDGIVKLAKKYPAKLAAIMQTAAIGQESNSKKILQDHLGMPKTVADAPVDLDTVRDTLFG